MATSTQAAAGSPRALAPTVATGHGPPQAQSGGQVDSFIVPIPISPRPAPPTPQEIQRKLGTPSSVPALSLADVREPDLQRKQSAGRHPQTSINTSAGSSADEDDSPSSPQRGGLPLSAISEASDGPGSGSDSDASSVGGAVRPRTATSRPFAHAMDRALGRISGDSGSARVSDNVAVKSGYLMKKGERRKAWKKRWFVLRGGQVAMYKTDKEYQLLRLIPLTDIHTCAPIEFKKHSFTFGIVTPDRTYYVKADSAADVHDWCTKVERAKEDSKALATVTSLDTPTPGDVTPHAPTSLTPTGAIPIPSSSSSTGQPASPPLPTHDGGSYSFATTAGSSFSPPTPFSNASNSALSSSFTSTSTAPPTAFHPRPPPNSFAAGAAGALGLHTADGNSLELGGVDAGLESLLGAQQQQQQQQQQRQGSFSGSTGGTSSGGEGRLAVPSGYFSFRGSSGSAVSPGLSSHAPSSPGGGGGGVISSSEDEDGFDGYENFSPASPPQLTFQDGTRPEPRRANSTSHGKASANTIEGAAGGFMDPNKVILSGYLMKQGKRRNWRKRWFVLMSGGLMYSRSHMDSKIHRQIPLARILDAIEFDATAPPAASRRPLSQGSALSPTTAPSTPAHEGSAKKLEHCFKIITPKRTYLVCAPSEEDEIAWLAALQCLVRRKQEGAQSPVAAPATMPPASSAPKRSASTTSQTPMDHSAPTPPRPVPTTSSSGFEVRREASTTTATGQNHGRQRSVTEAAKMAVRDGVATFRENGARGRPAGVVESEQQKTVKAG